MSSNWVQLWLVAVALLDDLLRIAGVVAIGFVIWGGIKLITSQGEPQSIANARNTIINALVGIVIALVASDAVNYLGSQLGATSTSSGLPDIASTNPFTTILDIVLAIVGAVSVLMVVIGGFKYVISRGEPQQTASAKNTILYALIGLAVVILAFTIVNFVIVKISS